MDKLTQRNNPYCPRFLAFDWLLDRMVEADIDYQLHEKDEENDDDTES